MANKNYRDIIKPLFENAINNLVEARVKSMLADEPNDDSAALAHHRDQEEADANEAMYKQFKKGELKRKAKVKKMATLKSSQRKRVRKK